jgi:hypothetical protein
MARLVGVFSCRLLFAKPGLIAESPEQWIGEVKEVTSVTAIPFRRDGEADGLWHLPSFSWKRRQKFKETSDFSPGKGQLVNALPKVTVINWLQNSIPIKDFRLASGASQRCGQLMQ